mgnify:CR=1 FL=1
MPRYLTEQDIADFRAELCKVATERFARYGYEGVTMRQLAEALGCHLAGGGVRTLLYPMEGRTWEKRLVAQAHAAGVRAARFNFLRALNMLPSPEAFARSAARLAELGWCAKIQPDYEGIVNVLPAYAR